MPDILPEYPLIELHSPTEWQELQSCVCRLFREIGLDAEEGKTVATPRGSVNLDVFAVDQGSVDKVTYVVECKNWQATIPQTVVHAFTTVLHEVGANIGYIISKKGLQSGAEEYTRNTNIRGMTYEQLQRHYFPVWFERFFVTKVGDVVDPLTQYIEPFNESRDRIVRSFSEEKAERFRDLVKKYTSFGMTVSFLELPRYSHQFTLNPPATIQKFIQPLEEATKEFYSFKSRDFRELLDELIALINRVTASFDEFFEKRPF